MKNHHEKNISLHISVTITIQRIDKVHVISGTCKIRRHIQTKSGDG